MNPSSLTRSHFCYFFFFLMIRRPPRSTLFPLHDALPISAHVRSPAGADRTFAGDCPHSPRSEEHTSELQSPCNLVCRLLLEKKKKEQNDHRCSCVILDHSRRYSAVILLLLYLCERRCQRS